MPVEAFETLTMILPPVVPPIVVAPAIVIVIIISVINYTCRIGEQASSSVACICVANINKLRTADI